MDSEQRKMVVASIRRRMEGRDVHYPHNWWTNIEISALLEEIDAPTERLNTPDFRRYVLTTSEDLWAALEKNELGGFSGINRPFHIKNVIQQVCEHLLGIKAVPAEAADDHDKLRRVVRLATDLTFQANRHSATLWDRLCSALLDVGAEPELPNRRGAPYNPHSPVVETMQRKSEPEPVYPAYGPGSITDAATYERGDDSE